MRGIQLILFAVFSFALAANAFAGLIVASFGSDRVQRYADDGSFVGTFAIGNGLRSPDNFAYSPTGELLVSNALGNSVLRYSIDGKFLGVFTSSVIAPAGLAFGNNGNLYVSEYLSARISRFHGTTGAYIGSFEGGGLNSPDGIVKGPDGKLYVSSTGSQSVLRFDEDGNYLGVFASGNGLEDPTQLIFGPDGHLYVSSFGNSSSVLRFDGTSGAFLNIAATGNGLSIPRGLAFLDNGELLVASQATNSVLRFDGSTSTFRGIFTSQELSLPLGMIRIQSVPEPSSISLFVVASIVGVSYLVKRRKTSAQKS